MIANIQVELQVISVRASQPPVSTNPATLGDGELVGTGRSSLSVPANHCSRRTRRRRDGPLKNRYNEFWQSTSQHALRLLGLLSSIFPPTL